jgi:hypothetical protein
LQLHEQQRGINRKDAEAQSLRGEEFYANSLFAHLNAAVTSLVIEVTKGSTQVSTVFHLKTFEAVEGTKASRKAAITHSISR